MSDYDMNFAKKLLDDEDFDTIFGAEEDNRLMKSILKEGEEDLEAEVHDYDGVEDYSGKFDDTSDNDIIEKKDTTLNKGDQLNIGQDSSANPKDGSQVSGDLRVDGDDFESSDSTFEAAFDEALKALMEEVDSELGDEDGEGEVSYDSEYEDEESDSDLTDMLDDDEDDGSDAPLGDEDDDVIDACGAGGCDKVKKEEANVVETRDTDNIEDKSSDNLGDTIGPNHDNNGVSKAVDDTSDVDVIHPEKGSGLSKNGMGIGDNAGGSIKDGSQAKGDFHVAGDNDKAAAFFKEFATKYSNDISKRDMDALMGFVSVKEAEVVVPEEPEEKIEDSIIDTADKIGSEEASDDFVNNLAKDDDTDDENIVDFL